MTTNTCRIAQHSMTALTSQVRTTSSTLYCWSSRRRNTSPSSGAGSWPQSCAAGGSEGSQQCNSDGLVAGAAGAGGAEKQANERQLCSAKEGEPNTTSH